ERDALVASGDVRAAIDGGSAVLGSQILEVEAGRTIGVHARHVDRVTGASRDVLDGQARLNRKAPLVGGMSGDFGRAVIGGVIVMRCGRKLEQAPGLVHLDRADDVGSRSTSVVAGAEGAAGA